jgi:gluconate 2-dehydrogenase gamma chain
LQSVPFRHLTSAEGKTLEEVTALLIPTDHDPGAREAQIARGIDLTLLGYPEHLAVYRKGLLWLNETSGKLYGEVFHVLPAKRREEVLQIADRASRKRPKERKAYDPHGVGWEFFQRVRLDTFALFYNHPVGWKMVGYGGPPQPRGHLDYADPPR